MSLPNLYFFDLPGRGEPTRLALHIGGIPFEDVRFTLEEWTHHYQKASPHGKAPWLILDGYTYIESQALLLWAAALTHLLPRDAGSLLAAKTIVDICDPLWHDLAFYYWKIATDPEGYQAILPRLRQIETQLSRTQSPQGYSVSAGFSFADLCIAVVVYDILNSSVLEVQFDQTSFPRMCRVYSLVMSHPAVLSYWKTTRHPMPAPLSPISMDYYHVADVSPTWRTPIERRFNPNVPLLRRSHISPDGSDVIILLLKLGEGEYQEVRSPEMENKVELQVENVSYSGFQGIILWAASYANLLVALPPEEQLLANVVSSQCSEIFHLHHQCTSEKSTLDVRIREVERALGVIEKTLQQSSMAANWSDICIVVVSSILKAAGIIDLQQSYPYTYLKKIQASSLHPRISTEINQLISPY